MVQLARVEVFAATEAVPATAAVLAEVSVEPASSSVAVVAVVVVVFEPAVAEVVADVCDVDVLVAAAMHPVSTNMLATLTAPAIFRARRAG